MNITLNGQKKELFSPQSLGEVVSRFSPSCESLSAGPAVLIAEVNGTIVKKAQWDEIRVNDGDTIELVSFVGGG